MYRFTHLSLCRLLLLIQEHPDREARAIPGVTLDDCAVAQSDPLSELFNSSSFRLVATVPGGGLG